MLSIIGLAILQGFAPDPPAPVAGQPDSPPIPGYTLVWSDEFDGAPGAPDASKWKPWAEGPRRDAVNIAGASRLDGQGRVVITTARTPREPGGAAAGSPESAESRKSAWAYTTGGLWTKGIFEPTYGYFEARVKFQASLGHWGAFWLNCDGMGAAPDDASRKPTGGGPGGVETDIIEFHHRLKNALGQPTAQQTLHWDGYSKDHKSRGHNPGLEFDPGADFHVYGMLWTADEYVFSIDGIETWRVRRAGAEADPSNRPVPRVAPSSRPEYLILSLEVGDWAGKAPQRDGAPWPDSMTVDWVRVWQKKTEHP